jgi:hypothetical protein
MNQSQKSEITEYLLSKKLPMDLLIEVQDHFISQIQDLQKGKIDDFENAFDEVKISWKENFVMKTWDNGKPVSVLSYTLDERKTTTLVIFAFISSIFFAVFMYCILNVFSLQFKIICNFILLSALLLPIIIYFSNIKNFNLIDKYKDLILNIHQHNFKIVFLPIVFIVYQFIYINFVSIDQFFKVTIESFSTLTIVLWTFNVIALFMYFIGLFSITQFLKVLKKTKPFLKNFENYAN